MDDIFNNATDTLLCEKIHLTYFILAGIPLFSYFLFVSRMECCKEVGAVHALMTLTAINGRLCLARRAVVYSDSSVREYKHITGHPAHGGS